MTLCACAGHLRSKREKCAARPIGTQISSGGMSHQLLDGKLFVCFDCGFGKINLSDQL
jgi:hypothetical protein